VDQLEIKEPGINRLIDLISKVSTNLGKTIVHKLSQTGEIMIYFAEVLKKCVKPPVRWPQIFTQLEFIGNQSLNIVLLSGFFTGAVFGLQIGGIFGLFKSESLMGAATSEALARELAPLMTGFLLAGRAGSSITAEISSMKVNEQIDAMEAMAVDPMHYLVVPRVLSSLFMIPFLCGIFMLVGTFGCFLLGTLLYDVDHGVFLDRILWMVQPKDIIAGLFKALVFAFIISSISCRYGLNASGGAKGVGKATTESVITSLLLILISDVIITFIQVVVL
jgi:phospholipid/cholesterol/gamma-HCH transport system permease protein